LRWVMNAISSKEKYGLMTGCIVPRPIAWVTTVSVSGILNAAPFSYFTSVSTEPPLVLIAIERRNKLKKDTLVNIEETGEFIINLVTAANVEQMNETSRDYEPFENEIEIAGLDTVPGEMVKAPRIVQSPVQMECKLSEIIEIGSSPHSLVIGEVMLVHAADAAVENGRIDSQKLQAVGRMGGKWYTHTASLFELPRLDWRKDEIT